MSTRAKAKALPRPKQPEILEEHCAWTGSSFPLEKAHWMDAICGEPVMTSYIEAYMQLLNAELEGSRQAEWTNPDWTSADIANYVEQLHSAIEAAGSVMNAHFNCSYLDNSVHKALDRNRIGVVFKTSTILVRQF